MVNKQQHDQDLRRLYRRGYKFSVFITFCHNALHLRTVPTIVIAHTFCASPDTRISYRQCLLIQGYFCAV